MNNLHGERRCWCLCFPLPPRFLEPFLGRRRTRWPEVSAFRGRCASGVVSVRGRLVFDSWELIVAISVVPRGIVVGRETVSLPRVGA